ncbi:transcriptional regulator with XRE-family HTH domain [Nocardiopsis mwathae]|uniref:Transcriptional regulator with XRE-family HTH domain n=1 Tax=Nocardiopsis mwathae TaxID=1472723 RepID=A0A7X0D6Z9_9ACTN|nr:helix-turn-helix transcriptional regulator [Nocardiopsis mwathae]MBB6173810.1 transcriptional regulator with XRE-family HTH domain [Nocardiopsis mwathae]
MTEARGMAAASPTARRRRLGMEMRRLRKDAGMTLSQVAESAECDASWLSRVENGRRSIKPRDLRLLLQIYGASNEEAEALVTLSRESKLKGWWQTFEQGAIPPWFERYVGLENEAASVFGYDNQLVTGLLQTEEYSKGVLLAARPEVPPERIEEQVQARLERQKLLTREIPLRLWAILDEAVLHRPVGGRQAFGKQLEHILELSELREVTVQVLPFAEGGHASLGTSFAILSFPEQSDPDVVYIEDLTSSQHLESAEDVARYNLVFDHLQSSALSDVKSKDFIARVMRDFA